MLKCYKLKKNQAKFSYLLIRKYLMAIAKNPFSEDRLSK